MVLRREVELAPGAVEEAVFALVVAKELDAALVVEERVETMLRGLVVAAPFEVGDFVEQAGETNNYFNLPLERRKDLLALFERRGVVAVLAGTMTAGHLGETIVYVTLPDNLTTWRMRAKAVSADTRLGQSEVDVIATQDFVLRPVLPRFFTIGDQAHIGWRGSGKELQKFRLMVVMGDNPQRILLQ